MGSKSFWEMQNKSFEYPLVKKNTYVQFLSNFLKNNGFEEAFLKIDGFNQTHPNYTTGHITKCSAFTSNSKRKEVKAWKRGDKFHHDLNGVLQLVNFTQIRRKLSS